MTDRYEQLFEHKSPQEADRILALCQFESKGEYFEHEGEIIRECFHYLSEGKSDAQCAYLLRASQQKAELSVNEGALSRAELHQLVKSDLSEEEVANVLEIAELESKEEYSFVEADSFLEGWSLLESEAESSSSDNSERITLIDLQKLSGQKITISEVLKRLVWCGLKEQDVYTQEQADILAKCCELKEQGRSGQEIAEHFGVRSDGDSQVKQIFDSIANLSELQPGKILETLAQTMVNQRVQVEKVFNQLTYTKLHQALNSGELEAKIDAQIQQNVGNELTLQAMVETWTEEQEQSILPPLEEEKNILPSSSTN